MTFLYCSALVHHTLEFRVSGKKKVDDIWDGFVLYKHLLVIGFALSEVSGFDQL
jgi:hypothetical protein